MILEIQRPGQGKPTLVYEFSDRWIVICDEEAFRVRETLSESERAALEESPPTTEAP